MNNVLSIIDENKFADIMNSTVEPYLAKIRKDDSFISFDGKRIHYEFYKADNAKAGIVISHGFTESAEKFREPAYYFLNAGYNVFIIDHRGHAQSYRIPGDNQTVKIGRFMDYTEDMYCFVKDVVRPANDDKPLYLYSHSMGGAVAIQFIEKYPSVFSKVLLSSPMVCCNPGMPVSAAKAVSKMLTAMGKGNTRVFGQKRFDPNETYETSNDTSEARYNYYNEKKIRDPLLRTSGPSFNWVKEAMANFDYILDKKNYSRITSDILLLQPSEDKMVLCEYQDKFCEYVDTARLVKIDNCKHEIYNSTNDVLEIYYKIIIDFFG